MKEDKHSNVSWNRVHGEALLDIEAAAERLGLSGHTLRAMVRGRKITFVRLGVRVLFRPQDLADYIEAHLVPPQAGPGGTDS